jgi:hypothetical protein
VAILLVDIPAALEAPRVYGHGHVLKGSHVLPQQKCC